MNVLMFGATTCQADNSSHQPGVTGVKPKMRLLFLLNGH